MYSFYKYFSIWLFLFSVTCFLYGEEIDFYQDLLRSKQVIMEDHPGVYNTLDPEFVPNLEKAFCLAKERLDKATSDEEKMGSVEAFGKSFNDAHLWVSYPRKEEDEQKPKGELKLEKVEETLYWLTIPSFSFTEADRKALEPICHKLSSLRSKTVVIDVRGNTGGNSAWGDLLLKALLGEEYIEEKLTELHRMFL